MTGTDVIYALRQGNLAAYEKVFTTFYKRLHAYAFLLVKDSHLPEEVVQEVFCRLWEQRGKIQVHTSLQAYLYTMVHHECLKELNRRKPVALFEKHVASMPGREDAADKVRQSQLEEKFLDALNRLPERCRLVFQLNRMEKLRYRQIADQLGLSEKTVENQMGKALKLLRVYLSEFLTLLIVVICHL